MKQRLLFLSLLVMLMGGSLKGWGQASLPVSTTTMSKDNLPTGFTHSGLGTDYAGPHLKFDTQGDYLVLFFNSTPGNLSFELGVNNTFPGTIPATATFSIEESSNGVGWTNVASFSNVAGGAKQITTLNSATRYLRWIYTTKPSGTNISFRSVNLAEGTASGPSISISPSTLTNFYYTVGSGPSTEQTFTISGSNLTANISIAASTNYEISKTSGTGYTSPLTFTQSGGTVSETTVYVRLKAGLSAGTYNSEVITASSTGAVNKIVTCSGKVLSPEPTTTASALSFTSVTSTGFTINWTNGNGSNRLVLVKSGSAVDADPVDGTSYSANTTFGSGTQIGTGNYVVYNSTGNSVAITGLSGSTTYHVEVFEFNGSGGTENYLTSSSGTNQQTTPAGATVINFDNASNWIAGSVSITSYASDHVFSENNMTFTGGPALRNTTTVQDGVAGALGTYSWRLTNADVSWTATYTSSLDAGEYFSEFGFSARRWDSDPSINHLVEFTIDGGVTWYSASSIGENGTINNAALDNSSAWKSFSQSVISPGNLAANNFIVRITATGSVERLVIDNFTYTISSSAATSQFSGSGNWSTEARWNNGIPGPGTVATIAGTANLDEDVIISGLTVNNGVVLTIPSASDLTINGTLTNNAAEGIVLKSPLDHGAPGSLIVNGSISGSGTIKAERYIQAYSAPGNGWHLISSPVNSVNIATGTNLAPGGTDDLYAFNETAYEWTNYKPGNVFTTMENGKGYLVSYAAAATKQFVGTPNNAAVTFTDLSKTAGEGNGWHLIGNPFQSAISWNNGGWTLTNIGGVAKRMSDAGSYTDVQANDIIPAMQGFFVQAENATNTLTIPLSARTHNSAQNWTKSGNANTLLLVAHDPAQDMYQESRLNENPAATEAYDYQYDSRFVPWYAPEFYSLAGNEMLSTNSIPDFSSDDVIPFGFKKNGSAAFYIELKESPAGLTTYLTDTKTGIEHNFADNAIYSFTAAEGDSPTRFLLHFGAVGVSEKPESSALKAYVVGGQLYFQLQGEATLQIVDMQGRVLQQSSVSGQGLTSTAMQQPAGAYVVRLMGSHSVQTAKVIVK